MLKPPPAEAKRLQGDSGKPDGREQMTGTAADHDVARNPRSAQPQSGCLDTDRRGHDDEGPAMIMLTGAGRAAPVRPERKSTRHDNPLPRARDPFGIYGSKVISSDNAFNRYRLTSADLLLHPVRLRVVQAFLGDRALTTSALRTELPDVPPASLYRHVARLVDAGVLSVVGERRVRGAVERTYVLRVAAASIGLQEVERMSREDHRHAFMAFVAGLLGDVDRYLEREDFDPVRDGAGYRLAGLWLSDSEFAEFLRDLARVIQPRLANPPKRGRRRRILGTVLLPGENAPK